MARLRVALLEEAGSPLEAEPRLELLRSTEAFFRKSLGSSDWSSWVAVFSGTVGAAGTLAIWNRPPYPGNPDGKDAYLLNMYTSPEFRGRGAATAILKAALQDAHLKGVPKVVLHATEAGRRLYAKAGFVTSNAYMEFEVARGEA